MFYIYDVCGKNVIWVTNQCLYMCLIFYEYCEYILRKYIVGKYTISDAAIVKGRVSDGDGIRDRQHHPNFGLMLLAWRCCPKSAVVLQSPEVQTTGSFRH